MVRLSDLLKKDKDKGEKKPEGEKQRPKEERGEEIRADKGMKAGEELVSELEKIGEPGELVSEEAAPTEDKMGTAQTVRPSVDPALLYKSCVDYLRQAFLKGIRGEPIIISAGAALIDAFLKDKSIIDPLYLIASNHKEGFEDLAPHSVNVAVYSIKIGQGLDYAEERLRGLGLAALLHDVGICKVPKEIISKEGKLTAAEYEAVKMHPIYGRDIILTSDKRYSWLAEIVAQEHEREGGQGYPRGLAGAQIHEYAKIIGVADIYEAMTHNRPQRKAHMPYDAVKEIIQTFKGYFPQKIIKVLLSKLSVFPINSYVRLNSRAVGMVVETSESQPLRPKIRLLYDSQGRKLLEKKVIDLQNSPLLYVVDSVKEEDLPKF